MDNILQKKAKELIDKHGKSFLSVEGVKGVCISHKKIAGAKTDDVAIQFIVDKKKPPQELSDTSHLPSHIDGIRTDVDEGMGTFRKFFDTHKHHRPLLPGISISNPNYPEYYGTLGCFVTIRKGIALLPEATVLLDEIIPGVYLVTNQHVLKYADEEAPQVHQPDTSLSWFKCAKTVALLNDGSHDCAIARIDNCLDCKNLRNEISFEGTKDAELGDVVYKYGAKTNYTEGIISHIHLTTKDEDGDLKTENIVVEGPSGAGDSGAVWVHKETNKVISLLWGGNERYSAGHGIKKQIGAFAEEWELHAIPTLQLV